MINHISCVCESSAAASLGYFFCDFADHKSLEIRTTLSSFIKQTLEASESIPPGLMEELEGTFGLGRTGKDQTRANSKAIATAGAHKNISQRPRAILRKPDLQKLLKILASVAQFAKPMYIVLDGLDECKKDDRRQLLAFLKELTTNPGINVKVAILSRYEADIAQSLTCFCHLNLATCVSQMAEDFKAFVMHELQQRIDGKYLILCQPSMVNEILEALLGGCDGMYVYIDTPGPSWNSFNLRKSIY